LYLFILKMSNDLFKISLNQGKQFNNYQTKIKKSVIKNTSKGKSLREGFVTHEQEIMVRPKDEGYTSVLKNQETINNLNKTTSQKDLDELSQLKAKYNDLIEQYTTIQKTIGDKSLETINRLSSSNPYRNKTIRINTGRNCYVTAQEVVKYISNQDIWNSTSAPKSYIDVELPWMDSYGTPGTIIPTNPPLISGTYVKMNQALGNEGKNVYTYKLIDNPTSEYIGCYNDNPPSTNINVVPVMNSSNNVNGFISGASSVYMGNNNSVGAWAAFDQNPGTIWHSEVSSATNYNDATGIYEGSNGVNIVNVGTVNGEFLQIDMPGVNTSSAQNITVNQYSLAPRLDLITTRSPNSWYVIGWKDNQWTTVDRQQNQSFTSGTPKVYNISSPNGYSSYILLVDKVGNDDQKTSRYCVQVAEWNLFMNSDSTMSDDKRAMIWNPSIIGYTTLEKCQEYAVDNGYQYFGLQDYKEDGTAACLVSNDLLKTQIYGDASKQTTIVPVWASNTSGMNSKTAKLRNTGRFVLVDESGNVNWQSTDKDPVNCAIQYSITEASDAAGNDLSHYKNVTLDYCQSECKNDNNCYGFSINTDNNNECWLKSQFKTIVSSNKRELYQKVKPNKQTCKFLLMLHDDGNLCLYQGTPDNIIYPSVWCTMTNGKQLEPNIDWEASKGTFGRNYIIGGEVLSTDQWIGSTNGSLKLIMQSDGNLVLYTSETKTGCIQKDKTYGGPWVNAVYKLNARGNKDSLGKVAFIDSESVLKEYPVSMLEYTNDYQIYQNTDSLGNDITSMIVTDETQCQLSCNNNPDCAAYSYMPSTTTCWLKNKEAYPKSTKYPMNDRNLGVRKPGIKGSVNCSNEIVDINTIQYDNYVKGDGMTTETKCNESIVSQADRINFDNIKNQLETLGQDIASKMENLYNEDNKVYEKLNMNEDQFKKDLEKYKNINIKIRQEMNLQSNNNIEGMRNLTSFQNMNDINGMLSDTDLIVLHENYKYIMWSILAVGILTITINTMKK